MFSIMFALCSQNIIVPRINWNDYEQRIKVKQARVVRYDDTIHLYCLVMYSDVLTCSTQSSTIVWNDYDVINYILSTGSVTIQVFNVYAARTPLKTHYYSGIILWFIEKCGHHRCFFFFIHRCRFFFVVKNLSE